MCYWRQRKTRPERRLPSIPSATQLIPHGDRLVSVYGHLDDGLRPPTVKVGDAVHAGDVIRPIGMTRLTTGPHLHFSVLRDTTPLDPRRFLPER